MGMFWTHNILILIIAFVYGVTLGSFYNVLIYRIPLEISIARGRSFCPKCGHSLSGLDLVPLLSWIFLRRRCRYCGVSISPRYFFVELTTGLLFAFAYWSFGLSFEFLLYITLWSMLLITTFIDFDHMIVSVEILLVFSAIGFAFLIAQKRPLPDHLMGAVVGFGVYYTIYFIAKLIYKKEAFGEGDVFLMSSIGLFLGFKFAILTAILAFYAGLIFLIVLAILKRLKMKKEIPFGPSICLAAFVVSLYGDHLLSLYHDILW